VIELERTITAELEDAAVDEFAAPETRDAPERVGPRKHDLRCAGCGYGAVAAAVPDRCPLCGGEGWDFFEWRPFLH
jgi:rubrerythrin